VAELNDFVSTHLGAIGAVIVLGCVVVILMILMLFIQSRRIALLSERLDDLTQGADGQSLEGVLASHLDTVVRVAHDLDEVMARTAILEGTTRLHFGRLGLVRFNPFDDTGGNQSFALAILDANNDGFVVTSLHSRTGTRLYAKAIFGGVSETTLGAEEAQAVEIAVSQGGGAAAPRSSKAASAGGPAGKPAGRTKAAGSPAGATRPSRPTKTANVTVPAGGENEGPETAAAVPEPAAEAVVAAGPAAAPATSEPEPVTAEAGSSTPSA
jgi:hypothetical protein